MSNTDSEMIAYQGKRFQSTQWSLVMTAQHRSSPEGRAAFAKLCESYWYPLYAHARRLEPDVHLAKDLTQGFFERVIQCNYIADADPARGRFRTFLLTSFTNYIANEWDKSKALRRGGDRLHVTLHFDEGEQRFSQEPLDSDCAEKRFHRRWAETLLGSVLTRLAEEYRAAGKENVFENLKGYLTGEAADSYRVTAARLSLTEGATRVAVHRLRSRYRERLYDAVAETTSDPSEIEDEIQCLFDAFSN